MIKFLKSNKLILLLLFIMCIIIIFNPLTYGKSCLNGISVWATKVMPLMFPFFVLSKLIANLNPPKQNFMDKFFLRAYNAPYGSSLTFFLSVLSGYPMGAKLISNLYENKHIDSVEAKKMMSFCSVSGPMFMIGTVGVAMLLSFKAGLIIFISNVIASLINGLIYRGKPNDLKSLNITTKTEVSFNDCVYDSLVSILMVGAYIVISFILIDLLENLNFFNLISFIIARPFKINVEIINSALKGILEITRGIFDLSILDVSLKTKTIISSGLIGFGGLSVMLQSVGFLTKLNIPIKTMLSQKLTQGILAMAISHIICLFM